MLTKDKIRMMTEEVKRDLLASRREDGMFQSGLSSSSISTAVGAYALLLRDGSGYAGEIQAARNWLLGSVREDGSWGDSLESPSNMTATLLSYAALFSMGAAPESTRSYLNDRFGGTSEDCFIRGVLDYYGKDLTFSVPILMMCALTGVIHSWKRIPPFPFELAILPQRFFRFLNLPVVSYAIPALIAVGILQLRRSEHPLKVLREPFVGWTMRRLVTLQPEDGGFLEAAPLTGFVSMCLSASGFRDHSVNDGCASFLVSTQREDGSWPIDTNLDGWVTAISSKNLVEELREEDRKSLVERFYSYQTREVHYFTGAPKGGWGWTDLSGSVPDGDDTSGALVALYHLTSGTPSPQVEEGLNWLIRLQNSDGGMPTFCRGWGKLPFDRSAPDITAHAVLAMGLWTAKLEGPIRQRCQQCLDEMLGWLEREQVSSGAWIPLWFGDQDARNEKAPVYGTATLMDYLMSLPSERAHAIARKGVDFLLQQVNEDGGWGGQKGSASKVTMTSRALAALSFFKGSREDVDKAVERGIDYLYKRYEEGTLLVREPIGLYFARLWYSENLYAPSFLLNALIKLKDA